MNLQIAGALSAQARAQHHKRVLHGITNCFSRGCAFVILSAIGLLASPSLAQDETRVKAGLNA